VIKILEETRTRAIWVNSKAEQDIACQATKEQLDTQTFKWDAKFDGELAAVPDQSCKLPLDSSVVSSFPDDAQKYGSSTYALSESLAEQQTLKATTEKDIEETEENIGKETVKRDDAKDLEAQHAGLEKSASAAHKARQKACVNLEDTFEARSKRREEEIAALEAALEVLETHSKNAEVFLQKTRGTSFLQMSK